MGMLDHRRTWQYEVNAAPEQCISAFIRAFSGSGGLMAKANWGLKQTHSGAIAVYKGRKGIGALGGILSQTSAHEADTALGSEVTFEVTGSDGGRTACSMWLSSQGRAGIAGLVGSTADGRFIRPYMQAVQKELAAIDPALRVTTG
jgi:hypothetical protein